jgi:hypothetical protein
MQVLLKQIAGCFDFGLREDCMSNSPPADDMQQSADFLNSKLGDKVRLERFYGDGHA